MLPKMQNWAWLTWALEGGAWRRTVKCGALHLDSHFLPGREEMWFFVSHRDCPGIFLTDSERPDPFWQVPGENRFQHFLSPHIGSARPHLGSISVPAVACLSGTPRLLPVLPNNPFSCSVKWFMFEFRVSFVVAKLSGNMFYWAPLRVP